MEKGVGEGIRMQETVAQLSRRASKPRIEEGCARMSNEAPGDVVVT